MSTLSLGPSLTLSLALTTSDNPVHRPFARGLLSLVSYLENVRYSGEWRGTDGTQITEICIESALEPSFRKQSGDESGRKRRSGENSATGVGGSRLFYADFDPQIWLSGWGLRQ